MSDPDSERASASSKSSSLLANTVLLSITVLVTLIGAEFVLRAAGFFPGFVPRFENAPSPNGSWQLDPIYFTDERGVYRANPEWSFGDDVFINSEGFRGPEFEPLADRPSVLMLGDSFTWGASATPLSNAFADRVSDAGYHVYNTGIPGTDSYQYAFLGELYTPRLKPDIVAVFFYMGNDFRPRRPMEPGNDLFHIIDDVWIDAYTRDGRHLDAETAYLRSLENSNLLARLRRSATDSRIMSAALDTVIGSFLIAATADSADLEPPEREGDLRPRSERMAEIRSNLLRIREVAEANGARFELFVIPVASWMSANWNDYERHASVFADLDPQVPTVYSDDYYMQKPNGHYNNAGHERFTEFVLTRFASE